MGDINERNVSDAQTFCTHFDPRKPDEILDRTLSAARQGNDALVAAIADEPVPVYLTDAEGWVTYFNQACIQFAGRTPVAGEDRWCVTWRLYTEGGASLAHEDCPMAVAIREKRSIRGVIAVAERPDGSRVLFAPFPTPIHDSEGNFVGAVNILLDVTDQRQAGALRAQAARCRRLAQSITDARTVTTLMLMASEYDDEARGLSRN